MVDLMTFSARRLRCDRNDAVAGGRAESQTSMAQDKRARTKAKMYRTCDGAVKRDRVNSNCAVVTAVRWLRQE